MNSFLQDIIWKLEFTMNRITFKFGLHWTNWNGLRLKYEKVNWKNGKQKIHNFRLPRLGNLKFKKH